MTTDPRDVTVRLVLGGVAADELRRHLGVDDGRAHVLALLEDAERRQDGDDADLGLVLGSVFGFDDRHLAALVRLAVTDWHDRHEEVVRVLGGFRSPAAVDALLHAATAAPAAAAHDGGRALARKAVRALAGVDDPAALDALRRLASTGPPGVREEARKGLDRRGR